MRARLNLALKEGIVKKSGAWFYYGDEFRLGQGRDNAKTYLEQNPAMMTEIENKIREKYGLDLIPAEEIPEDADEAAADLSGEN